MNQQNPYQTPQQYDIKEYDIHYEYAGFWVRLVASIIDSIAVGLLLVPLVFLMVAIGLSSWEGSYGLGDFIINIFSVVFYVVCWTKYATTPGKYLFKLKILDADTGEHLTPLKAFIRYIGYIPSTLVLCLGFIWIAFDDRKQGWHDKMANSVVVKEIL